MSELGKGKMRRTLSTSWPSLKPHRSIKSVKSSKSESTSVASSWTVYLIVSTQIPRTYVGVTVDFSRRLKEHNGEIKCGAKATRAGRPWTSACIVRGFKDRSDACTFESQWKSFSRKLPRKKKTDTTVKQEKDHDPLLQHRQAALERVQRSFDCSHLEIDWQWPSS